MRLRAAGGDDAAAATTSLAGTVKLHHRHVFVGLPPEVPAAQWPSHIEQMSAPLAGLLRGVAGHQALGGRNGDRIDYRVASGGVVWDRSVDEAGGAGLVEGELLVLPDNVILEWPDILRAGMAFAPASGADPSAGQLAPIDDAALADAAGALLAAPEGQGLEARYN